MLKRFFIVGLGVMISVGLGIAQWKTPTNLGAPVNSSDNETRPSISSDGNTLYLSSDRSGGEGGDDIWVTTKVDGEWQEPINLGPPINTEHADFLPSINEYGTTLYFISNRPGSQDLDIWVISKFGEEWGTPVNLEAVNSPYTE